MDIKAVIVACAVFFVLGEISLYLVAAILSARSRKKRRTSKRSSQSKNAPAQEKESLIQRIGVMNLILIVVGVSLLAFTVAIIRIFLIYGAIPDTLVTCVFAALGGECGVMGMIKTSKEKYRDREWQKEDRQQTVQEASPTPDELKDRPEPDDIGQ